MDKSTILSVRDLSPLSKSDLAVWRSLHTHETRGSMGGALAVGPEQDARRIVLHRPNKGPTSCP